ncbi:MAG: GFA family protein [Pseudomonadota bacterium]
MKQLTGRCFCGAVQWTASADILWAAICHCEDCRRAASSDYVSWFGVERKHVTWSGPRQTYHSSSQVTRSFCAKCGAPMSFETDVFPEETHLYAATLDTPEVYEPSAHIFWSERLPWVQPGDDLPRHEKGLQNAAAEGKTLL